MMTIKPRAPRLLATMILVAAVSPTRGALSRQRGQLGFEADVEVVRLHAAVLEGNGNPVTGLGAEDFTVVDDGVEYPVAFALTPGDTPIDVALVFDQSESIRQGAPTVKQDARAFLAALGPGDCAFVLPFQHRIGPGVWGPSTDPSVLQTVDLTSLEGGTSFYDALFVGLSEIQRWNIPDILAPAVVTELDQPEIAGGIRISVEPPVAEPERPVDSADSVGVGLRLDDLPFRRFATTPSCGASHPPGISPILREDRRKALLVLTDGVDTTSAHSFAELLGFVQQSDVPIFAVAVGHPGSAGSGRNRNTERAARLAESRLRTLTEATGGKYVQASGSSSKLQEAYEEIVAILRGSYLLGYYPRPVGATEGAAVRRHRHAIEVKLRRGGVNVFARSEYDRSAGAFAEARVALRRGAELVLDGRPDAAVQAAEQAIAAAPRLWEAHFLAAAAHWTAKRSEQAHAAVGRALWLEPGVAVSHHLAWQLNYDIGDDEAAWRQAILALLAGAEMEEEIGLLAVRSAPPPDLEARLRVPRVFVEGPRGDDLVAYSRLAEVTGAVARAVSASPMLGLVRSPLDADYFLYLDAEDPDRRRPGRLDSRLELYNYVDRRLWREDLNTPDIGDPVALEATVERTVAKLEEWLADRR